MCVRMVIILIIPLEVQFAKYVLLGAPVVLVTQVVWLACRDLYSNRIRACYVGQGCSGANYVLAILLASNAPTDTFCSIVLANIVHPQWKGATFVTLHQSVHTVHRAIICFLVTHVSYALWLSQDVLSALRRLLVNHAKMDITWVAICAICAHLPCPSASAAPIIQHAWIVSRDMQLTQPPLNVLYVKLPCQGAWGAHLSPSASNAKQDIIWGQRISNV